MRRYAISAAAAALGFATAAFPCLARQNGNVARTSDALGVPRTTLHDKIRKYGF